MADSRNFEGLVPVSWAARYRIDVPEGPPPRGGWPLLVALHGFGDDGARIRERLRRLDGAPYARLFPDGPFPVEMHEDSGLRVGFAWYQYTGDQPAFMRALAFADAHLQSVVDHAAAQVVIDRSRVVLLGYSQGGYLAGVAALRDPSRYHALIAISCRIKTESLGDVLPRRAGYPVLILHGERDPSMPVSRQQDAATELRRHGVNVEMHVHAGGHGLRGELVPLVDAFVRRVTPT